MHFHILKICCKVVPINNFQWKSCLSKNLDVYRENTFEIDACLSILQHFQGAPLTDAINALLYYSISEMAASIYMCDLLLERVLYGLIRSEFILHKGAISAQQAHSCTSCLYCVALKFQCIFSSLRTTVPRSFHVTQDKC